MIFLDCYNNLNILQVNMSKINIVLEFLEYIKVRKKWLLAPIILILALFSTLVVITEGTAIAPFIYALF